MKNKTIVMIASLFLCLNTFAQEDENTEYFTTFVEFMLANSQEDPCEALVKDFDEKMLYDVAKDIKPKSSRSQCKQLAALYKETQLKQDLYEVLFLSHLREQHVSLDELKQAVEAVKNPQYQEIVAKSKTLINFKVDAQFLAGMKSKTPLVAVDCPESYQKTCRDLYEVGNVQSTLSAAFDVMAKNAKTNDEKMFYYTLNEYMIENGFTWYLNTCYGQLAEDELLLMSAVTASPAIQRISAILPNAMKDMEKALEYSLFNKYKKWLYNH